MGILTRKETSAAYLKFFTAALTGAAAVPVIPERMVRVAKEIATAALNDQNVRQALCGEMPVLRSDPLPDPRPEPDPETDGDAS